MKRDKFVKPPALARCLPAYGIAAGAALAAASSANAALVYSTNSFTINFIPENAFVGTNVFTVQKAWDIDGSGSTDFSFGTAQSVSVEGSFLLGYMGIKQGNAANQWVDTATHTGYYGFMKAVPSGFVVGAALAVGNVFEDKATVFPVGRSGIYVALTSGTQYLGFKFTDASNNTHYGWATATVTFSYTDKADFYASTSMTISNWAYDSTADQSVVVGVVPEPSVTSLALLAIGAAGVAAYKRQRRGVAQAS